MAKEKILKFFSGTSLAKISAILVAAIDKFIQFFVAVG